MYRVEDKYILSENDMYSLENRLSLMMELDSNQRSENGYGIYSVYFDDVYDTHLTDTIDGNNTRDKYRIRIYDNSFDTIKLEIKHKLYNRISKTSASISYEQMQALMNGECIEGSSQAVHDFNIAIKTRLLKPKVIVAYNRKAYVRDVGNVRITFDTNIRYCDDVEAFGREDAVYGIPNEYNSVLEVKYDEFLPDYIAQILEIGQMQQTSYSKYVLCRNEMVHRL